VVSRNRVASLNNGMTIIIALLLAAEHHRNAEIVIATLIEHSSIREKGSLRGKTGLSQIISLFRENSHSI